MEIDVFLTLTFKFIVIIATCYVIMCCSNLNTEPTKERIHNAHIGQT